MTTIIGPNANTKATNAIDISFSIIEPYGLTLIDRLRKLNFEELNGKNYLEMPYLLEINFYGTDDAGATHNLSNLTKFIPIKFTGAKIKADVKGTVYDFEAVPYNHQGYFSTVQDTKANFEVTATTVADFFKNDTVPADTDKQISDGVDSTASSGNTDAAPTTKTTNDKPEKPANANTAQDKNPTVKTKSYTAAYNAWNEKQVKKKAIEIADEIEFIFHPDIRGASVVIPGKTPVEKSPQAKDKGVVDRGNDPNMKTKAEGPDRNKQVFSINAGTNINALLDQVIVNSSYIRDQVTDPSTDLTGSTAATLVEQVKNKDTYINWYRVVPKVSLKKGPNGSAYDKIRNTYGKKITYYVIPYKYYNSKDPRMDKSSPPPIVKEYNYLYTGLNKDILEFNLDFDALFYTAIHANTKNTEAIQKAPDADNTDKNSPGKKQPANTVANTRSEPEGANASRSGGTSAASEKQNAQSVAKSIYSGAAGDMLNVNLKIVGDPAFIKQDDMFHSPATMGLENDEMYLPDDPETLAMDNSQVYCSLAFRTYADIDEETGLMRNDSDYSISNFSGIFQVLKVESELAGGKFIQSLDLIRQHNLPGDDPSNKDPAKNNRAERNDGALQLDDLGSKSVGEPTAVGFGDEEDDPGDNNSDVPDDPNLAEDDAPEDDLPTDEDYEDEDLGNEIFGEDDADDDLTEIDDFGDEYDIDDDINPDGEDVVIGQDIPEAIALGEEQQALTAESEAMSEAELTAGLSKEELDKVHAQAEAMTADLTSDDPVRKAAAAEKLLTQVEESATSMNNFLIDSEKVSTTWENFKGTPEYEALSDKEKADGQDVADTFKQQAADARVRQGELQTKFAQARAEISTIRNPPPPPVDNTPRD
jgi:hypothetical protein